MNDFMQLLRSAAARPEPVAPLGSWVMSASPLVAEAMGAAGFAWSVVDMEHSPLDLMGVVHLLQAVAATPMLPVTRVPWNDRVTIKRVLDAGAETLLVPFVQNADEARHAVASVRYPPDGLRGMAAMGRASRFGTRPDHYGTANARVGLILQLETAAAVAELSLDPLKQAAALWRGQRVNLPLTAQRILATLHARRGEVVGYDELFQVIKSGRNRDNVRKHVSTIREAFREIDLGFDGIENVPMRGFRWLPPK